MTQRIDPVRPNVDEGGVEERGVDEGGGEQGGGDVRGREGVPGTGAPLAVEPARLDDPVLLELVWRARRLAIGVDMDAAPGDTVREVPAEESVPPRRAAVLIAVCADENGLPALLLTERAGHLAAHPGQIAFPGGKIEPGESAEAAALREAHEEVDLPAPAVRVLGGAAPYLTRTGFLVVPVLALLRERVLLRPNPGEVDTVFTVPFADVMTLSRHREVETVLDGRPRTYFEVYARGKRIWGVTAAIMRLLHEKLYAP